ncbi:vinorine synthase-like [Quillaja saponaria]|uniref:Vinorine synthase-like n=1 Tax=Quillaja saponaria TaxID=32244 RepID=A0AAD7QER0_QUISA|nr:vinorine synthase-like [Quillaja saponaria]KAJ7979881.1 vinorine synthase-like [Quillaja saponaria]
MELISRETIKPLIPTPPHLRTYTLSFFDHISTTNYVPIIFFYTTNIDDPISEISNLLKKSLSQILTQYYPLADKLQWEAHSWSSTLLAIQINFFDSGGMAISVCMSHKIADAVTMTNFVKDWSNICLIPESNSFRQPVLNSAIVFPQGNLPVIKPEAEMRKIKTVTRRYVFDSSKIDALKAMVSSHLQIIPTRVQVVLALLHRCAASAMRSNHPTTLMQLVNLRPRMEPPLPTNSMGNMSWHCCISTADHQPELHDLVSKLKESLEKFTETYVKKFKGEEWFTSIMECLKEIYLMGQTKNLVLYNCSSWCRFGHYEVDFGWGKPIWVTSSISGLKNMFHLIDARDGQGIEAIVSLEEKEMTVFENDEELLAYACSRNTQIA